MPGHILVVDDDPGVLRYMRRLLELETCQVQTASSGTEALDKIKQGFAPDLIFLDVLMPGLDGLQTLEGLLQIDPRLKVVMLSCVRDTAKVVRAIRLGAEDYLHKPLDGAALQDVLQRCVLPAVSAELVADPEVEELPGGMFFAAASPAMKKIRFRLGQVAQVNVPVLLLGESGTGKEVAALMIHKLSPRRSSVFLKVNCAAIPSELLESELFGYEAGAFTGATHAKPGKFELCNGGTILLDEIGEMPPGLQAKLLQVLQEQRFFRLGSRSTVSVDVRILAATNIDIDDAIKKGKLRLDLYYRLNAFTMNIPPLRQRREDIPLLFRHFMRRLAAQYKKPERDLSEEALESCLRYSWPGNIRELQNVVKRMVVLGDELHVLSKRQEHPSTLPHAMFGHKGGRDLKELVKAIKRDAEAEVIAQTLQQTNGNRREAAALLNISYKALVYKTQQYGLDGPSVSSITRKAAASADALSDAV
jgi:DNA-binding NtrC family response regulator